MNEAALIAQIAQEVMTELAATGKSATPAPAAPAAAAPAAPQRAQTYLVIATSAQDAPEAVSRLKGLPGQNRIVLAAPKYANSLLDRADLAGASVQYLDMGNPEGPSMIGG